MNFLSFRDRFAEAQILPPTPYAQEFTRKTQPFQLEQSLDSILYYFCIKHHFILYLQGFLTVLFLKIQYKLYDIYLEI